MITSPAVKRTCIEGLHYWGRYQPDRAIDFNAFFWARPDGGVLFDPLELNVAERAVLDANGGARYVIVTNFDHVRATPELAEEMGLEVYAPFEELPRFGELATHVDGWYTAQDGIPDELEIDVHELPGGKTPVEMALYLRPLEVLLFGDMVRSHESGRLRILPDEKIADRREVVRGLQSLADLPKRAVCLGDGDSAWWKAEEAYADLLARL